MGRESGLHLCEIPERRKRLTLQLLPYYRDAIFIISIKASYCCFNSEDVVSALS